MVTTNLLLNNVTVTANKIVEIRFIKQILDGTSIIGQTITSDLIKPGDDYSQQPELAQTICRAVFGA